LTGRWSADLEWVACDITVKQKKVALILAALIERIKRIYVSVNCCGEVYGIGKGWHKWKHARVFSYPVVGAYFLYGQHYWSLEVY